MDIILRITLPYMIFNSFNKPLTPEVMKQTALILVVAVIFAGISAIDIALWDSKKGQVHNAPVHEQGRKTLPSVLTQAYASQLQFGWGRGYYSHRLSIPERTSKRAVDDGYDCIKIDFFTFKPDDGTYTDTDRLGLLSKEVPQNV